MAKGARPRAKGWYPDPEDPAGLRYNDGEGWTHERRPRPDWDLVTEAWPLPDPNDPGSGHPHYDGPVRPAELPAIAAAVSTARHRMRSLPAPAFGKARGGRPTGVGRGGGRWPDENVYETRADRRRPFILFVALCAFAFAAMVITVGIARPYAHSTWALTDHSFVAAANSQCASTLPPIRVTSVKAPNTVANAKAISALGQKLQALPVALADRSEVSDWLSAWQSYSQDVQTEAAQNQPDSQLVVQSDTTEGQADAFAVANGLTSCTLSANPGITGAQPYS